MFFQERPDRVRGQRIGKFVRVSVVRVDRELSRRIRRERRQQIQLRNVDASPKIVEPLVNIAELVVRTDQMQKRESHD